MAGLKRSLPSSVSAGLVVEQSTDRALEQCEEIIIAAWRADDQMADKRRAMLLESTGDDMERYLDRQIYFEDLVDKLQRWLEPREYPAQQVIAGPGSTWENLELLLSGRATAYDHSDMRLYQIGPGDAIRPFGALHEKVASVVADEPCRTMLLTPTARRWLEEHEERLALRLYRYLLGGLSHAP